MSHAEPDPNPLATNVLWGRVATAAVVVLLAFGLGRCTAPGEPEDGAGQLDAQVVELQSANNELQAQVDRLTEQVRRAEAELEREPTPTSTATSTPSPTTEPAAPAPADGEPGGTWTVAPGDTLHAIAIEVYGDRTRAELVAAANNIDTSTTLQVGQVLQLPIVE